MKKQLSLLCILGCIAQPVWASSINPGSFGTGAAGQSAFKAFSEDMGSALSYKAVTPATPLGITGFDLGLEASSTKVSGLSTATGGSISTLIVPKVHVFKGLPFGIDVGAFYSSVPTTNIKLYGGELRYAIMEGGVALPAVGIRAAMTKLSGVSLLSLNTKSLDVSISKGFAMITPYAGLGTVWVDSTPDATTTLAKESFRQNKIFAGGNLNLGLVNFALEYDKTGSATSYSAKFGFRF